MCKILPVTENYCHDSASRLQESLAGFRKVPKTGVIYVMDEASKAGYCAATAQEWAIPSDFLHFLGYDFICFPDVFSMR